MRRTLAAACLALTVLVPAAAHAHGTIPTDNAIAFGPGMGSLLLGTNFGAIVRDPTGALSFICEMAVTGFQQSVDAWLWLPSGEVFAAVTKGGFVRGVFGSDPSACGYTTVAGTEPYLILDLVASSDGFFAVGSDDIASVLLAHSGDTPATTLYTTAPTALPIGVRAAGRHTYATFVTATTATLVHHDGTRVTTHEHTLAEGESLRPLGVSPTDPRTIWLTRSGATGDTLVMSDDAGATLTPVLTVDARLGGFAIAGDDVWLQSTRGGVHHSRDGGRTFVPLAGSPHGTCLAFHEGRLYACGVPWQDGYALGVSDDGLAFTALIPAFDDIAAAIDCPALPDTTTTCAGELDFLRGYYGFTSPTPTEPAPETTEAIPDTAEPTPDDAEPTPDTTDPIAELSPIPTSDDGCTTGSTSVVALLALASAFTRRRRCPGRYPTARVGSRRAARCSPRRRG